MTIQDLWKMDFSGKEVLIIGNAASGKSWLAMHLHNAHLDHALIHTDDFMHHGYEESLYALMRHIKTIPGPKIIEGIQGYRLLRKGVETGEYFPDVVIDVDAPWSQRFAIYQKERDPAKVDTLPAMDKRLKTVFMKWNEICPPEKAPEYITVTNIFQP